MEAIEVVGSEFYGRQDCFPSLEELVFENMLNWKEWTSLARIEGEFPCLRSLLIRNCPRLLGQLPNNLSSLKCLVVGCCNAMLVKSLGDLTSLTYLSIYEILEPTCLPINVSLPSLKELFIRDCNGVLLKSMVDLTSLTNLRIHHIVKLTCLPKIFTQSLTTLETLDIRNCRDLTCLWEEGTEIEESLLPFNLKHLRLKKCRVLESLPDAMMMRMDGSSSSNTSMLMSRLESCEVLESLPEELGLCTPNLNFLVIGWCENFKSLPNTMYQLKSLQKLWMFGCPRIEFIPDGGLPPNLIELQFERCENLKFVPNIMSQLTSLHRIRIPGSALTMGLQKLTSLRSLAIEQKIPLNIVLPSSLTYLQIEKEENLESTPGGLFQNLSSLQKLSIVHCPKLRSLPREAFPPSLGGLYIESCPHLKQQRFEEEGDYWTLTWSIPCVKIDDRCV
ncbi:hypothetical protein SLE2022_141220 [Rubroshorea leprosula]